MDNKIIFDTGLRTYQINEKGVLRFNPSDPNVYKRFKDILIQLEDFKKEYKAQTENINGGSEAIDLLADYDQRMKKTLAHAFGKENDFDSIFEGANIMAITKNGEMVITNFLEAIRPVIEDGIKSYAKIEAQKAIQEAEEERKKR